MGLDESVQRPEGSENAPGQLLPHCPPPPLLQELREQSPCVLEKDTVRWVLTVPAIWKQPAKQFMREAAYLVRMCGWNCAPPQDGPGGSPHLIHPSNLRTRKKKIIA